MDSFTPTVIARIKEGDLVSMELVYNSLFRPLLNYINTYINNYEQSKEITQDCFLSFWEKRHKLQPDTNIKAFLLRVGRNKSLNFLKKQLANRNYNSYIRHRELGANYQALKDKTAELVLLQELQSIIDRTLKELPEPYRIVFEMSREKNLSYAEIAELLGVSVKTVEYRMMHTLRLFRNSLRPYLPCILLFISKQV